MHSGCGASCASCSSGGALPLRPAAAGFSRDCTARFINYSICDPLLVPNDDLNVLDREPASIGKCFSDGLQQIVGNILPAYVENDCLRFDVGRTVNTTGGDLVGQFVQHFLCSFWTSNVENNVPILDLSEDIGRGNVGAGGCLAYHRLSSMDIAYLSLAAD